MGNVTSYCCSDTVSEVDGEQARILDEEHNASYEDLSNTSALSQQDNNDSKTIEQSALDKIYQKMASSVIDVAPGEPIQQAEFIERQKAYQTKLSSRMPRHHCEPQPPLPPPLLLPPSSPPSVQERIRADYVPVSSHDVQLISDISLRSAKAIRDLKINSHEQVIVNFMA